MQSNYTITRASTLLGHNSTADSYVLFALFLLYFIQTSIAQY